MSIVDINGEKIEVTNLDEAIKQAAMFSTLKHDDKTFENTDKALNNYWQDMLNKLKALRKKQ
jgi:hypothetical protein